MRRRRYAPKRTTDMRFVIHCALLLLAFVGLATVIDHWTAPVGDDGQADTSARQMPSSDDNNSVRKRADPAKNLLSMKPVMVLAIGLAAVAVHRPSLLSRRLKVWREKWRCDGNALHSPRRPSSLSPVQRQRVIDGF